LLDKRVISHCGPCAFNHQEIVALGAVVIVGVGAQRVDTLGHGIHAVAGAGRVGRSGLAVLPPFEIGGVEFDNPVDER